KQGARYFDEAIAIDPGFAPAYAGLADSYTLFADYGLASSDKVIPRAKMAAAKALGVIGLKAHPAYENLRSEPRCQAILNRLGMAGPGEMVRTSGPSRQLP